LAGNNTVGPGLRLPPRLRPGCRGSSPYGHRPQDSAAVGGSFNPVHVYLLVQQGVHIGEFHNLERLAAERVYEFAYVATTNAIRGSVAGTALRPLALR
jgi:hypothetical protein